MSAIAFRLGTTIAFCAQNFVPGAATDGTQDSLSAYNNATRRRNISIRTISPRWLSRVAFAIRYWGVEVNASQRTIRNAGYRIITDMTLPCRFPIR